MKRSLYCWKTANFTATAYIALCCLFIVAPINTASAQAVPTATIPVGDGPYALDVSADGKSAIVSLLFPARDEDPNLFWVDLESESIVDSFRVGRRLFRINAVNPQLLKQGGGTGFPVVMVNGDVDKLTVVELSSGAEIAQIPTGQNPSNVEVIQSNDSSIIENTTNLAIVTNGTGGSLSFLDLDTLVRISDVKVGGDPRATATIRGSKYLLVVLRAENAVAILDLESIPNAQMESVRSENSTKAVPGPAEIARLEVGQDPTDIEVTPDGQRAVVTNLTNNTISILNISNPGNPRIVRNLKTNGLQFPVGVQPTSIAITPDSTMAFVSNSGSSWITIVDLVKPEVKGILRIQQPGSSIASSSAAVRVTPDGEKLLVAESGNSANLLVYEIATLDLEPLPAIDIPDEPGLKLVLDRLEGESCGYFTSALTLQDGAEGGTWGMEVLTTSGNRLLEGGLNLGGAFDADARSPGFGAFNIANRGHENQIVTITIDAVAIPTEGFSPEDLGLSVQIVNGARDPVTEEVLGSDHIELEAELEPGFYIVRIKSLPGSPRGTFLMGLLTKFVDRAGGGFQGGANVGGYITRKANGNSTTAFAGFCVSENQDTIIRTEAGTTRGPIGAGNLVLTIRNRDREIVQQVSNSIPAPPSVDPPLPPTMLGIRPDIYVDARASSNGNGSSTRPFKSITHAVGKAASRGDVILVRAGTYSPSLTGEVLPIGSPGPGLNKIPEGVLLIGSGAADTIIDAENDLRSGSPVNAMGVGSSNVRIAGFTVRSSSAVGIFILNADQVQIDSNYFIGNGRFAVGASGTRGLVIRDNVARANNETGFSVANAQKMTVSKATVGCPSAFGACIIGNIANEHSRDGFLLTQGGDYHVLNNTAMNNGIAGIELNNRGNVNPLTSVVRNNLTANNGGVLYPFAGNGILVTEFAHAEELIGNQSINNRPGGIAVFEDSSATIVDSNVIRGSKQNGLVVQKRSMVDTVSGNQVTKSGLAGIFVENNSFVRTITDNQVNSNGTCADCTSAKGGLAVLGNSSVGTVTNNSFDRNSLGMQIANSASAESITGSSFDNNESGGVMVREASFITDFYDNTIHTNGGQASIVFDDSSGLIRQCSITSNEGTGVSLFSSANLTIQDSVISDAPLEGIAVYDGSTLNLTSSDVLNNANSGILASGEMTSVVLEASKVNGNMDYGLNAQNGATITCQGANTLSGNTLGATLGNVQGCN